MQRSEYESQVPVESDVVFQEIQRMNVKANDDDNQIDSLSEELKDLKKDRDGYVSGLRKLITAAQKGLPVYKLKDGELTTETPDAQTEFGT